LFGDSKAALHFRLDGMDGEIMEKLAESSFPASFWNMMFDDLIGFVHRYVL